MDIAKIRQAELDYCRDHPDYFVRTYCHIEDKDAEEIIQPFYPWPMQAEALDTIHKSRLSIILKARQLGMTWLVLCYAVLMMLTQRGSTVIALSRTEEEAKELVRRLGVVLKHMPEFVRNEAWGGAIYRSTALSVEVAHSDGTVSTFKAFPSSPGAGRSFTANLIILDEWAFQAFAREIWLSAYPTINRPTGGKVIGLSTIERGTLFEELYTADNGFTKIFLPWYADPRRDQAWYDRTKQDLGDLIMQEYPATIDEALTIPGGSYFPEFKRHIHVIQGEPEPHHLRYVSMDYGLDMFAVLFYEVDTQGNAIVYKQIHESDLIVSQAAQRLLEVQGTDRIERYYAPPDLWNRNRDTGKSTAEIFKDYGIHLTPASSTREQGCLNVKEYLKPYTAKNEQTGQEFITAKLLVYEDAAPDLVRCLTKIQKDKNKPNEYSNTPHELTHIVDALRYFCISRPLPTKQAEPNRVYNFDFERPKPNPIGLGNDYRII
jgi:hypothetical protein